MRSLLIGLDGSPFSDAAIELALAWGRRFGAVLVGLGIVDEPTIRRPTGLVIGGGHYKPIVDEQHLADARRKVGEFLADFHARCTSEGVRCHLLEEVGLPHEEIVEEAQRYDAIVLGQQSYFHFETQEGPGETLFQVLRGTPRPVITVPRELPAGRAVLVAYDGSLQAARTLQALAGTGLCRERAVHVLSIDDDEHRGRAAAARAIEFLSYHDVAAECCWLPSEREHGEIILEQAAETGAGLIAMGAYGQPSIREFFFGSALTSVLKQTTIPLLLYH